MLRAGDEGRAGGGRDALALALVVVAATALPYASSLAFGFTLDDASCVLGHRGVRGPLSATDLLLRDFWGRSFMDTIGSWRPAATLTYWIDWHAGGGRPWVFHATNLALYAALLVTFERFLRRFFDGALSPGTRRLAVGVFGLLAIHADVVPSVTGRAEILAALFSLVALLLPLRPDGPVRTRSAIASAAAGLLAMASKESALPIALLAPLLAHRWHSSRGTARGRGMAALAAASAATLAGVVAFRTLRMPWMSPGPERAAENALIVADAPARLFGAGAVLVHYLAHLACPWRLAPDYSYSALDVGHEPALAAAGVALAIAATAALAIRWRRGPGTADALLGLGASYVVVSHVFVPAIAVLADRLFFFPSLWVVTLGALAAERARGRARRIAGVLAVAFAAAQGAVAARDGATWRDDVSLLTRAVDAEPAVARSRRNLAEALAEAGRPDDAAWQQVVSRAILARYPAPVPASDFPPWLDREPAPARVDALRRRIGECALRDRLREAGAALHRWGFEPAARRADGWLRASEARPPVSCAHE